MGLMYFGLHLLVAVTGEYGLGYDGMGGVRKKHKQNHNEVHVNLNKIAYQNKNVKVHNFVNEQHFTNVQNHVNTFKLSQRVVKENDNKYYNDRHNKHDDAIVTVSGIRSEYKDGGRKGKVRHYPYSPPYKPKSKEFILFVTDRIINATSSLPSRKAANKYCASYAKANNLPGKHFRIIYSTAKENARDFLAYTPKVDRVCTRSLELLPNQNIYGGNSPVLPDMVSFTITNTGPNGKYETCNGLGCGTKCKPGTFPICQSCNRYFTCGARTDEMLSPKRCCWTGVGSLGRAVMCMGSLGPYDTCTPPTPTLDSDSTAPSLDVGRYRLGSENDLLHAQFIQFTEDYEKEYPVGELLKRFEIFKANQVQIAEHNARGLGWTMAMNEYGDLTGDEFHSAYTGYRGVRKERSNTVHLPPKGEVLPDSLNWVVKGAVTPVKNQGQCGSCWAFSTTGSVEGVQQIATGTLLSLSEQQLVDCSTAEGNEGCNGGLMDQAFDYIIKNGGITSEDNYPYTGKDGTCKTTVSKDAQITSYTNVKKGSEPDLASALQLGPVSIAIEADQSGFQFYSSGVFAGACGKHLDHGVLLVGYGTENGVSYWLVKNSWGESWGDHGYIKLVRGQDQCGLTEDASYPNLPPYPVRAPVLP